MYSKPIIDNSADCELAGWTSEGFGPNGAFTFPLIINHAKGQKNQVKYVQTIIEQAFIRIKK